MVAYAKDPDCVSGSFHSKKPGPAKLPRFFTGHLAISINLFPLPVACLQLPDWQSPLCVALDVLPIITLYAHGAVSSRTQAYFCNGVWVHTVPIISRSVSAAVLHQACSLPLPPTGLAILLFAGVTPIRIVPCGVLKVTPVG